MTKREAALILGVRESAVTERVKNAHRKILLLNHPDRGGSAYVAAKVNEAKDLLLKGRDNWRRNIEDQHYRSCLDDLLMEQNDLPHQPGPLIFYPLSSRSRFQFRVEHPDTLTLIMAPYLGVFLISELGFVSLKIIMIISVWLASQVVYNKPNY